MTTSLSDIRTGFLEFFRERGHEGTVAVGAHRVVGDQVGEKGAASVGH